MWYMLSTLFLFHNFCFTCGFGGGRIGGREICGGVMSRMSCTASAVVIEVADRVPWCG